LMIKNSLGLRNALETNFIRRLIDLPNFLLSDLLRLGFSSLDMRYLPFRLY
jgi:hypothetical protein